MSSRGQFHHWCFQVKIKAASNVAQVTDDMLHACGGVGYKKELGKPVLGRFKQVAKIVGFAFPTNFMEAKDNHNSIFLLQCVLGLERLLRDGKAGWVMGASNEVLRQLVGKTSLFGPEAIDFW